MKKRSKRLLAVLLAMVMIVGMLPVGTFAATDAPFTVSTGTISKYADGYYLVEVPGGTTAMSVTLDEDLDLSDDGGNKWYSWGDFDETTYDSSTYTYNIALSEIAYNGEADLAKFGCAAGEATYYYFETLNNDTWDTEYRVLIKETATSAPFSTDTGTISQYSDTKYVVNVPSNTTILQVTTDQMYVISNDGGSKIFDLFEDWVEFGNMSYDESTRTYAMDLSELTLNVGTAESTITGFGCSPADGIYYYFEVQNEDWETQYSVLVKAPGATVVPAATPSISRHPVSATYDQGDDPVALTVTVSVSAGTLRYAWYAEGSDEVLSTEATFTPPTDEVGITKYYVVITNSEAGKEDVAVTSKKATIEVQESLGEEPEQNDEGYYILDSKADLFWFAGMVNREAFDGEEMNAELGCDIDLEDEPWTAIGAGNYYYGHFNGNGFSVTGINIAADENYEGDYVGFFGCVESSTIENIKLYGNITVTEDAIADYVGGLAGDVYSSTLKKCISHIDIVVESEVESVGGLLGCVSWAEEAVDISYCASVGNITMGYASCAAGLIGSITGCEDDVTISYCYYKGNLVSEADSVGGIIGYTENNLVMTQVYTFATISDDPSELPEGVEATTIVGGIYVGDIFGLYGADCEFNGVYCISEYMGYMGDDYQFSTEEVNGAGRIYDYETLGDFLTALNSSDDEAAYTLSDEDNSPILAWELQDGVAPDQKDQLLQEGKEQALADIETLFETTYLESNYEEADWNTVTGYREAAKTAVKSAAEVDQLSTIISQMKTNIDAVPTAAEQLAAYIQPLIADLEKKYYHEVQNHSSVQKSGYKYDLDQYLIQADRLGVMHELKVGFLAELEAYKTTLLDAKNNGITAIENAKTKAEADTAKAEAIAAMAKVVEDAKAHTVNNGVADKWDGTTKTQPSGSGTEASPYQISNGAELAWFADAVNSGNKNLCAVLTKDIDLNGKSWTPIAQSVDDANGYAGIFDGNGHKIHGLAVTVVKEGNQSYGGLFGNVGKNGVVKSVSVAGIVKQMLGTDTMNTTQKAKYSVGGIAGRSSGIIYNCESSVVLTNGTTYSDCNNMGGIVGYQMGGIIESCTSYAILYKNGSANFQSGFGGVTGRSEGTSLIRYTDSYANIDLGNSVLSNIGGITGTLFGRAQIRECRNFGTIVNGCGIAGNVLEQAGVVYVLNSGTVSGENGIGESGIRPAAGVIGVLNSTGAVSYIYNNGNCKYGLINNFQSGTVMHAQSSSEVSLWGTADAQNAFATDCLKVDEIDVYESTEAMGDLAWAKLEATLTMMGKLKTATEATYGPQSTQYNAIVLQHIRRIELAKNADEINSILSDANAALNVVQTQLEAEKENVIAAFEAFVAARVYDQNGTTQIKTLLEEAKTAANAAATLKALNNVKEAYLGTGEQPGKFETECDTYNTKAKNELYDAFIYEKKYSTEDMASMLSLYEQWAVRIDAAASVEEVETVFADARFAMNEAVSVLTETDVTPDMDAAAQAALTLAKESAEKELLDLAESYKASMKTLVDSTNGKGYASGIMTAIQNVKTAHDTFMDTTSAVDFSSFTEYARIEAAKNDAMLAMQEYEQKSTNRMNALIADADNALAGAWDGVSVTEPSQDNGTYQISNGAELAWIAKKVNEGFFKDGVVNAVLTQDIDLGYNEWTPIGTDKTLGKAFAGTFDGNGFTVNGLYFSESIACDYYGLFGVVRSGAVIKNLTVKGTFQLHELGNNGRVGSIVAVAAYGRTELKNCVSYVDVIIDKITNYAGALSHVGGLIGYIESGVSGVVIENSAFRGSVTVTSCNNNVEGIGGIIGKTEGSTEMIRNVNYGEIVVDRAVGVGGIVGLIDGFGSSRTVTITDCANLGDITNDAGNVLDSKGGTGGIAGIAYGLKTTISGCYNTGTITASKIAGGILGGEYWSGSNGTSTGNQSLAVKNCYNAGTLVGPNNQMASQIGSLAGYPLSGEYKDGLYVLDSTAQAAMGWKSNQGDRIFTVSAEELIRQFADGTNMVESIAELNKGYPIFAWQLLDMDTRQAVIDYLAEYFESNIKDFASAEQKTEILAVLNGQSSAVLAAADAGTIIAAYKTAMQAMDKEALLSEAKSDALDDLDGMIQEYLTKYSELAEEISAFKDTMKSSIEAAETPADVDIVLDRLDAAVVDLLIADIGQINNDLTEIEAETAKEKIALAEEAYNSLSDAKKQQVSKFITLREAVAAMQVYDDTYAANKAAADIVTESIKAIGEVTLDSKESIETAMNGYNALTDKQKAMVSIEDYNTLLAAQVRYNELVVAYNADVKATNHVIALINDIGTVTLDSKRAIDTANNAYNALSDAQKAMVSANVLNVLNSAKAQYDALVKASEDKTDNAGTSDVPGNTTGSQQNPTTPENSDTPDATTPGATTPEATTPETDEPSKPEDTTPSDTEDNKPVDTTQSEKTFDWSVVWISCAIVAVALVAFGMIRWFIIAKNRKRK